jgi:hypothetical protein
LDVSLITSHSNNKRQWNNKLHSCYRVNFICRNLKLFVANIV